MATIAVVVAGLAGLGAYYGPATHARLSTFGVFRELLSSPLANPADVVQIADTVHCEDLHYYAPAHTLFTACEDVSGTRFQWFPPLAHFDGPDAAWAGQGSLHTIDPETKQSRRLAFENFEGPFVTHGIDVIPDPAGPAHEAVYIFAVNHVPNEDVFPRGGAGTLPPTTTTTNNNNNNNNDKARSRIEVFHHRLGSGTVRHVHAMAHPLIKTPNDVYAVSPTEVYTTNDHYYREGPMRLLEDVWPGATWSDVVHSTLGADGRVRAAVVVDQFRNPNGLGHGRTEGELLLASAMEGHFWIAQQQPPPPPPHQAGGAPAIVLQERIDLASNIDNPSWFADPYAGHAGAGDASGFVLGGLTRGFKLATTSRDPQGREGVMVWYVTPSKSAPGTWDKRLLWQDDGRTIRNAATAVLVAIDPEKEGGARKAWLFVTGFSSEHTVAVKVDLF